MPAQKLHQHCAEPFLEGTSSGTAARCRMPRQSKRVSCVGADVDAVLGSRDLPIPDHSFIVGKEFAFSGDQMSACRPSASPTQPGPPRAYACYRMGSDMRLRFDLGGPSVRCDVESRLPASVTYKRMFSLPARRSSHPRISVQFPRTTIIQTEEA